MPNTKTKFYLGSYNYPANTQVANGQGIATCEIDPRTGVMRLLATYSEIKNPSYILVSRQSIIYAISEINQDESPKLYALQEIGGQLQQISSIALNGDSACHLSLNEKKGLLAVSSYSSGSLEVFTLKVNGGFGERLFETKHRGNSAKKERQESAHIHSSLFTQDGKLLLVADLGIDQIVTYHPFSAKQIHSLKLPSGSGPRHLLWSKDNNYLFVVNELSNTISLCRHMAGKLEIISSTSTLKKGLRGESYASAIKMHPSGKYLYVSNRGEDSIAVFHFDEAKERLTLIQTISSLGNFPRDLELCCNAKLLVVTNQNSNDIHSYFVNSETGLISNTKQSLKIVSPVCICFSE